ncbi:unnamed protein product [Cuscuta epithymum]|uniref:Uncharacterized protein n=1 Tax=Cuscuta epithymum TaxID=186058 RepID=A0AAV0DCL7_9ASTE|nr:unnamed protein product [Cuscuta epithymum]
MAFPHLYHTTQAFSVSPFLAFHKNHPIKRDFFFLPQSTPASAADQKNNTGSYLCSLICKYIHIPPLIYTDIPRVVAAEGSSQEEPNSDPWETDVNFSRLAE